MLVGHYTGTASFYEKRAVPDEKPVSVSCSFQSNRTLIFFSALFHFFPTSKNEKEKKGEKHLIFLHRLENKFARYRAHRRVSHTALVLSFSDDGGYGERERRFRGKQDFRRGP